MRQDMQSLGAAVMLSGSSLPDVKLLVHESFLENLDHKSLVRQELTWVYLIVMLLLTLS